MRGRKPKSVEQKRREGNPGKRALPEPLKLPAADPLAVPEGLPAAAVEVWEEIVGRLTAGGVTDPLDRAALQAMCVQWARAEAARAVLAREGLFATGSMGQLVEHPALAIERQAHALFLRFAEQYGLTAAARARIVFALRGGGRRDELDDIVSGEAIEVELG